MSVFYNRHTNKKMGKNRVCEILGIEYPIAQAPMGWITSAELAAAVSNAGGIGCLGPNGGQCTITPDVTETAERMRAEIKKTRELTDKPFAVNHILPIKGYDVEDPSLSPFSEALKQVYVDEGVKIVFAVGNMNVSKADFAFFKENGMTIVYRAITPTVENAKAAEAAGADIIVATSFDEGGCMPAEPLGTISSTMMVADAVNVPVMAAGGIVDSRTANAALALGAEGIYMGTRFIPVVEGPAHEKCKQHIVDHENNDLIFLHTTPICRTTPTEKGRELAAQVAATKMSDGGVVMNIGQNILAAMINGDLDEGLVVVNNNISQIKKIQTCKEVIDEIAADTDFFKTSKDEAGELCEA